MNNQQTCTSKCCIHNSQYLREARNRLSSVAAATCQCGVSPHARPHGARARAARHTAGATYPLSNHRASHGSTGRDAWEVGSNGRRQVHAHSAQMMMRTPRLPLLSANPHLHGRVPSPRHSSTARPVARGATSQTRSFLCVAPTPPRPLANAPRPPTRWDGGGHYPVGGHEARDLRWCAASAATWRGTFGGVGDQSAALERYSRKSRWPCPSLTIRRELRIDSCSFREPSR